MTAGLGISNANFGTSAAWLDYDRDGKLDLFVANYVQWTPKGDLWCSLDGATKSYCTPESYKGTSCKLFHNLGGGKFEDVSQKAGIGDPTSKSLGVTVFDYNNDGWPDIFVANDTQPNKLYRNNKNGTFTEEGMAAGVAFGEDGVARGAMGVDAGDYDRSGRAHLLVGNFSNQMLGLYHNEGTGLFVDEAPSSTVGRASLLTLAFGVFFFDYDLDGYPDIFTANGHIEEEIGRVQPKIQYKEPPLLFHNLGKRQIRERVRRRWARRSTAPSLRAARPTPIIDHDGDLDVLITTNHGPAYLYRNDGGNRNKWLCVRLVGTKSNRDGIGAVVRVESASGKQWNAVQQRRQLLLAERSGADLRAGQGSRRHGARNRVAQRHKTAAHQYCGQSVPHDRRKQRDRRKIRTHSESRAVEIPLPGVLSSESPPPSPAAALCREWSS